MEEEIDASPTSQKKRKKSARRRVSQKVVTSDRENQPKSLMKMEQSEKSNGQSIEHSDCSQIRNNIWQSAYLLELADKVQPTSEKRLEFNRCNRSEFRMLGPADFLTVSQLFTASQPTTSNNVNNVQESQWDVTESQFRKLDDAVLEFQKSEIKKNEVGTSDLVEVVEATKDESNYSRRPAQQIVDDNSSGQWMETESVASSSLKRRSSVLQSILAEWSSSSPMKMKKTKSDVIQLSPHFKFNKKRIKRTYSRKSKKSSPATTDVRSDIVVENFRPEIRHHLTSASAPTIANDEDDDFDESMNIVDNIQNLSKFFSQPFDTTLTKDNVDWETSITKPSVSLDDEEDFFGFDGDELNGGLVSITLPEYFLKCDKESNALASITLCERFYEFSDDSSAHCTTADVISEHEMLMEDDDIFANFQTQQCAVKVNFEQPGTSTSGAGAAENLNDGSFQRNLLDQRVDGEMQANNVGADSAKTRNECVNIFKDIENDSDTITGRPEVWNNLPFTSASNEHFADFSIVNQNRASVSSAVSRSNDFTKVTKTKQPNYHLNGIDSGFESLSQRLNIDFKPNAEFTGFSTVTGKPIHVSSALISKKMNIFENEGVSDDELKNVGHWINDKDRIDESNKNSLVMKPNPTFPGFTTASGGHISVSSELMSKKVSIFDSVRVTEDELNKMNNWMDHSSGNNADMIPNPALTGFTTARGKQIPVSSKKTNIFQNVTVTGDDLTAMDTWISDNDRIGEPDAPNSFGNKQSDFNPCANLFTGFTTGRGASMPKPSALMSRKINIFDDVNVTEDELNRMNNWINDNGECSTDGLTKRPISKKLFSEPVHHVEDDNQIKQSNSMELFREVTNIAQRETESIPKKLVVDTFIKPSPMRKMSMLNSLRKLEALKENVEAKLSSSNTNKESVNATSNTTPFDVTTTPTSSKPYIYVTPTNNANSYTQICRESAAAILEDDEMSLSNQNAQLTHPTPGFVDGFMAELFASSTPINRAENFRNRPKQRRLVETFDDIAAEDCFESIGQVGTFTIKVSTQVKTARKCAFAEQQKIVKKKFNVKPVPSALFVSKLTSTKVNWKEFVGHNRPMNRPVPDSKLTNNVLNVTAANASQFKFNAWDHYSEEFCRENISGIYLKDDIVVMMDENCQIGLTEISSAFLSCPSVDPKLVHHKWIENHMIWIVVKLAAMERSFPHQFAGRVLTLENFMLQMKYRYEREIDRAERSPIRRICEMDDIAEKRMILFVAGIRRNGHIYDVELSDGWYSLMSAFDFDLKRLVDRGKIKVGTKLLTQGATALDLNNGCHPLDVSSNVKLRIHANSTRRARWDAKLGYCKNPGPFEISLRSVCSNGGTISKMRICVLRVYPMVYVNAKIVTDIHSEKVEQRRSLNDEREKANVVQKLYIQASKDIEEEEKMARCENQPSKILKLSEISSIDDPVYLWELLNEDKDPERIQNELTNTQRMMVQEYAHKLKSMREAEAAERVTTKLDLLYKDQAKYIPLLKFKVTDYLSFDKHVVVTIWRPTEDILTTIKEETVFDLTGSATRGISYNELQIYAGKDAIFQKLNVMNTVPTSLRRRYFSLSEILSIDPLVINDLDIAGFVVCVGEIVDKFQPVYIADSGYNIVCINFLGSVKAFAYDDIVQPKRILAIRNLNWRTSTHSDPIPCTYVSEYSVFTENPQSPELTSAIKSLKIKLANVDLDEFIRICIEKVSSYKPSDPSPTPNPSNSMLSLSSSLLSSVTSISKTPGRSTLSNQSRIEQLSKYGDPLSTPPLNINGLKKGFKLPVSKT